MEMAISSPYHKIPSSSSSSLRRNSSPASFSLRSTFLTPTKILFSSSSSQLNCRAPRLVKKNKGFSCNCLFGLGVPELVVIAGVVALVFGPKKLPEVGRSIGKTVKSFQQAAKEFETELKKEPDSATVEAMETTTVVSEEENDEGKVPSTRES